MARRWQSLVEVAAPVLDVGRLWFSGAAVEQVLGVGQPDFLEAVAGPVGALDLLLAAKAVNGEAEAKALSLLVPRLTKAVEQVLGVEQPGFLGPVAEPVGVRFVVVLVPLVVGVEEILEAGLPEFLSQTFEGVSVLDVRPQLKRIQVQLP